MIDTVMDRFRPPAVSFPPLDAIEWSTTADMIRFRADNRPRELLEQPLVVKAFGRRDIALVADPVATNDILFKRPHAFPKASAQYKLGHAAFGPGLSGTIGDRNERQRCGFASLSSGPKARIMSVVSRDAANDAVDRWLAAGTIDLAYEMAELALQIAWATLLGPGIYEGRDPAVTATIDRLYEHPKGDFVTAAEIVRQLAQHFEATERWHRVADDNPLKAITNPNGWAGPPQLPQDELRANAIVLAASGHVTTGLTLAWSAWFLAVFADYQERINREGALGDKSQRTLLRQVVSESLRLLPPGAEVMREAREPLTIDDRVIDPGTMVIVSIYALHRHRRLWRDPDMFRPERFAPESPEPVMPSAFLPFSGGPFGCTGAVIGWAEVLAVLGVLFERAKLEIDRTEASKVGVTVGTCIYPDRPLKVRITPR